MIVAT